ncbi:MAG: hypothetical protein H6735_04465 [Alphaproteobacteria bacterium]|nr:hypothetical protein [Alphaproteobacteria bacterium]
MRVQSPTPARPPTTVRPLHIEVGVLDRLLEAHRLSRILVRLQRAHAQLDAVLPPIAH